MSGPERGDVRAKLIGLHTTTKRLASGKVCIYAYITRGGDQLAKAVGRDLAHANLLLEAELGSKEVLARYAELEKAVETLNKKQSDAHIFGLVTGFLASPEFEKLAKSTRTAYRSYLERFRDEFGEDRISMFDKPGAVTDLTDWRDDMAETTRAADYAISAVSRLFSWARSRGRTQANPTKDIERLHRADRSDVIWSQDDLDAFCAQAAIELQWAVRLAAYTGLRQGDLLRLPWSAVSDFAITLRTSKSRGRRLVVIPLMSEARTLIALIPRRADTVLTSSLKTPWTSDGFRTSFRRRCADVRIDKHFHDLRGTAATRLRSKTDLSSEQIAGIMGWSPARVDRLMALYVSADVVALDMLARMDQKQGATNRSQTGVVDSPDNSEKAS